MKLAFISDTHGYLPENFLHTPVDILFHCGDICPKHDHDPTFQAFWLRDNFYPWLESLPAKHKVFISGNHDFVFQDRRDAVCKPPDNCYFLEHESITLDGLNIFGSPWQPWFYDWAWNAPQGEAGERFLKGKWADIPLNTDILITHSPPYGILDVVSDSSRKGRTGCKSLFDVCNPISLPNLKIHGFGHLHENEKAFFDPEVGIMFINAAMTDNRYRLINTPIIVEI